MESYEAADVLEALGNPTRLEVFRLLVRAGNPGMTVGKIQKELNVPASTLTHHLQRLVNSQLIRQRKMSREIVCCAEFDTMDSVIAYLTHECCVLVAPDEKDPRS